MAATIADEELRIGRHAAASEGVLSGMTFVRCQLVGPAVIAYRNCTFIDTLWDGKADEVIWQVDPARVSVVGVIVMEDCRFEECAFSGVGIAAWPDEVEQFRSQPVFTDTEPAELSDVDVLPPSVKQRGGR